MTTIMGREVLNTYLLSKGANPLINRRFAHRATKGSILLTALQQIACWVILFQVLLHCEVGFQV